MDVPQGNNVEQRTRPQMALQATLEDLEIRSAVESTMKSLLIDVELSANLHKDLVVISDRKELEQRAESAELALEETRAVEQRRRQNQSVLADDLVKELWKLSRDLGSLQQWKLSHQSMVNEHDALIAQLLQAEEQIRVLQESIANRPPAQTAPQASVEQLSAPAESSSMQKDDSKPAASQDTSPPEVAAKVDTSTEKDDAKPAALQEPSPPEVAAAKVDTSPEKAPEETKKEQNQPPLEEDQAAPETSDKIVEEELAPNTSDDDAVVALLQDEEEPVPTLDTIDQKILNQIFEFLDALEILSTAQVNIIMYSRVDALFGFGGGEETVPPDPPTASDSFQQGTSSDSKGLASTSTNPPVSAPLPSTDVVSSSATSKLTASTTSASTVGSSVQPPQATAAAAPRTGGIFSLLQARGESVLQARQAGRRKTAAVAPGFSQPLSSNMANSMAEKLSDTELGAIISMKENLHKREKDVQDLTKEREELAGKLAGTEALKEFLVQKVREVEQSLSKRQEDESKVTQQIASDQEVIAFLDGRVQELERDIRSLTEEKKSIVEELARVKVQNEKKITVLSDMLQFERERVSENEREWKSTKKLLVKEIKNCRAQLVTLQAERDGFREQNERLKRALVSSPNASNGSYRD